MNDPSSTSPQDARAATVEIWTMGEMLAEIMRPDHDYPLDRIGPFLGPFPSGAPAIFIDTVARLGHTGAIVSAVGADEFGSAIIERLRRDGVRLDLVEVVGGRSTGVAFVAYDARGERSFLFHWDGTPAVMARVPPPAATQGATFFHVMGCSMMANETFRGRLVEAVEQFADQGARISFDPNIRTELLGEQTIGAVLEPVMRRCSILVPGASELRILASETDLDVASTVLMRRYPLEMIVVKQGRQGCRVYAEGRRIDVPAFEVVEVDPTGAGDCFDAGLLCGLLDGQSPRDAARQAAAVGALNAAAFGPMEGDISRASVATVLASSSTLPSQTS